MITTAPRLYEKVRECGHVTSTAFLVAIATNERGRRAHSWAASHFVCEASDRLRSVAPAKA
jgi:hypothetical protein